MLEGAGSGSELGECCCDCCLDFENLPNVCIDGYDGGNWSPNEAECCAVKEFKIRVKPRATFIDGGDLDYNENKRCTESEYYVRIDEFFVQEGTRFAQPPRECPPCGAYQLCGKQRVEITEIRGVRYGIRYSPWKILVKIQCVEVACGGVTPEQKYVVTSTMQYLVDIMVLPYQRSIRKVTGESAGCCTETSNPDQETDSLPYPPSDPRFWGGPSLGWGSDFGCLSDMLASPGPNFGEHADTICEFKRWKILDTLPSSLAFQPSDCPLCEDANVPDTCINECCYEMEGVSIPGPLLCSSPLINQITCTSLRRRLCNGLWRFTDQFGNVVCQPFFPVLGEPNFILCPSYQWTARWVQGETPVSCNPNGPELNPVSAFDIYPWLSFQGCLFEGTCVSHSPISTPLARRITSAWGTMTKLTQDNFCSGGTDREICIAAPTIWIVKFPRSNICFEGVIDEN